MSAGWDQMIVAATLDDISNGSAIYLQVGAAALLNEPPEKKTRIRRNLLMRVKVLMEFS